MNIYWQCSLIWKIVFISALIMFSLLLIFPKMVAGKELILDFKNNSPGQQPPGWLDQDQKIEPAADIAYDTNGKYAVISAENEIGWGTVRYPIKEINLKEFDMIEIDVKHLNQDTSLVVDLYTYSSKNEVLRCGRIFDPKNYTYRISHMVSKIPDASYGIQLTVEGGLNRGRYGAVIGGIRIYALDNIDLQLISTEYTANFKQGEGRVPKYWRSDHNNASIRCRKDGKAEVTLGKKQSFGDVITPIFAYDTNIRGEKIVIDITDLNSDTYLDVVLQEEEEVVVEGNFRNIEIYKNISRIGHYEIKIGALLDEYKFSKYSIKLWINGVPGKSQVLLGDFKLKFQSDINMLGLEQLLNNKKPIQSPRVLRHPPETNSDKINIGVEKRIFEDFGNIQEVQRILRNLEKHMKNEIQMPLHITPYDALELQDAYQRGEVDIILSYQGYFAKCHKAGQIKPWLTIVRQGKTKQACCLYVKIDSSFGKPPDVKGKIIGYTQDNIIRNIIKYLYPELVCFDAGKYFKGMVHEKNVRNLLLALPFQRIDAIVEMEYIEQIANKMEVELIKIGKTNDVEHTAALLRKSKNPKKNREIIKLANLLMEYHKLPESRTFMDYFGVEKIVEP